VIEIDKTYVFAGWENGLHAGRKGRALKRMLLETVRVEFPDGQQLIVPERLLEGPVPAMPFGSEPCVLCKDSGRVKAWVDVPGESWLRRAGGMEPCPRGCSEPSLPT